MGTDTQASGSTEQFHGDTSKSGRHIDRVRRPRKHQARSPCPACGTTDAHLLVVGNQATVRCGSCKRFLYNAPLTETGQKPRTVRTLRRGIRPAQQARILNRDRGRCVLCGTAEELTIGHLLSVADGATLGATEHELNSDANLAAMCEGCNLGLLHAEGSVTPRTYAVLIWRLVQAEISRKQSSTSSDLQTRLGLSHPDAGSQ